MALRIGIVSDTHGILLPEVTEVLKTCSVILHAGDVDREELLDKLRPMGALYVVRGNCDGAWAGRLSETLSFSIEGVRFFMVHDRRKRGTGYENADVFIFGHSHRYEESREGNRLFLNPGSCGRKRCGLPLTMAVMTISGEDKLPLADRIRIQRIDIE